MEDYGGAPFFLKRMAKKTYEIIERLGEDDLVAVTERPQSIAAERRLLQTFRWLFIGTSHWYKTVPDRILMSETVKEAVSTPFHRASRSS
jgi:hypothetical protein